MIADLPIAIISASHSPYAQDDHRPPAEHREAKRRVQPNGRKQVQCMASVE
jgi:hypothetical protein